jgi:hypothetical protein
MMANGAGDRNAGVGCQKIADFSRKMNFRTGSEIDFIRRAIDQPRTARAPNDLGETMRSGMSACALGLLLASISSAGAQNAPAGAQEPSARVHRRPPLQVEVTALQYYRECVDKYVIEHRASGDTVVPRTYCRWVVRR